MTDDSPPTRRRVLRAAGATAVLGALAGCGGDDGETTRTTATTAPTTSATSPAESTRRSATAGTTTGRADAGTTTTNARTTDPIDRSSYDTVVDVTEAGADPSGEKPVDSVVEAHTDDDTLLYFPPGRYRLGEWRAVGHANLAVVGEDATLVPPAGVNYWLQWGDLADFRFQGFTIDCRRERVAPVAYLAVSGGENVVRDVTVRGHRRADHTAFEVAAADPDAGLLFENVALPDGSTNAHAIYVYPKSVGRLTFRNCRVEHWKEGLYASYHSGPLKVVGGYYANNGVEQVRVGGATAGALVDGVTVRVDDPRNPDHKPNMRGIWAEEGAFARIRNCDVAITDLTGTYSSGAIVVGTQYGRVVVENTRVRVDENVNAVNIRKPIESMDGEWIPSMNGLPDRTDVTVRNVRISGSASEGSAIRSIRRDDCRFENCCISQPKGTRNGVSVLHASGCSVRNSIIDVGGDAITSEGATVTTSGVRTDGSC